MINPPAWLSVLVLLMIPGVFALDALHKRRQQPTKARIYTIAQLAPPELRELRYRGKTFEQAVRDGDFVPLD